MEQWHKPFIINNFGRDYNTSYILKTLDKKLTPNIHHGNNLCIFYS